MDITAKITVSVKIHVTCTTLPRVSKDGTRHLTEADGPNWADYSYKAYASFFGKEIADSHSRDGRYVQYRTAEAAIRAVKRNLRAVSA